MQMVSVFFLDAAYVMPTVTFPAVENHHSVADTVFIISMTFVKSKCKRTQ